MRASESTNLYFNQAADQLELPDWTRKLLITPKREVTVQVAFERDDGRIETVLGYRVQHGLWGVLDNGTDTTPDGWMTEGHPSPLSAVLAAIEAEAPKT